MPPEIYGPTRGTQDHNPQLVYKAYEEIVKRTYPGQEAMVGAQFWGTNELETRGLHNEVLMHTGLLGQAADLGDDIRASVPMATFATADQIIAGWNIVGIGYEYYPEELEDDIYDIVAPKVGELPRLLADKEEDMHFAPYNNGETLEGGWAETPLFVDGTTDFLQIIGQPGENYGSNIIEDAGGVSYHLIAKLEQYGENFISEEGTLAPLAIDRILASPRNARLLRMYFGAPSNIEQDNQAIPNPVLGVPEIYATHRLANPNDMIVFYQGWEQDLKYRAKYNNRLQTAEVGHLNQRKLVTITRSRVSYYWFNNRRVVLVRGAAV